MSNTQTPQTKEQTAAPKADEVRKAEANGHRTATVEFRGETFTVPLEYDEYSVDFLESVEEGKVAGIVRGALGPTQWRTVRSMNLKVKDLAVLADDIAQAMGFGDSGESSASSD